MENDLLSACVEIVKVVANNTAILNEQDTWLRPFSPGAKLDIADDGLETRAADIVGELLIVSRADRLDRRLENLHLGIGKWRNVIAKWINTGLCSSFAILH